MALAKEVIRSEAAAKMDEAIGNIMVPHLMSEGVVFSLRDSNASTVRVAGDFNDWNPDSHPMNYDEARGIWRTVVPLDQGTYQYRFVVDGEWRDDPNNPNRMKDPYGGMNSVIEVKKIEARQGKTKKERVRP